MMKFRTIYLILEVFKFVPAIIRTYLKHINIKKSLLWNLILLIFYIEEIADAIKNKIRSDNL